MKRFAVMRTKDDNETVLYIATDKEDGLRMGEKIFQDSSRYAGIITLERREFDENNDLLNANLELFKAWR